MCTTWRVNPNINYELQFIIEYQYSFINNIHSSNKYTTLRTSLVAQWLRIRLPMQRTRVPSLVREDPTCRVATGPMCHNYWACVLEPASHNYWACVPQLLKPARLEPVLATREATAMRSPCTATKSSPCSMELEKARAQQRRPNTTKNR